MEFQNENVNPELVTERKLATFNTNELTAFIDETDGSRINRKEIESKLSRDPNLPDHLAMLNLSPADFSRKCLESSKYFERKLENLPGQTLFTTSNVMYGHIRSIIFPAESAVSGHTYMFVPLIYLQASDEQKARWIPLIENGKMYGSYVQTELGHGTNMRALETTATYDSDNEEFILNSPTIKSTKCWPGGLASASNFAVVIAQLYSKGQCHGLHAFMVQLRNLENHSPLPGITLGSIGPKMGLAGMDNGFLHFDKVKIPREDMFMKSAKVLKDGTYVKPPTERTSYGALVIMRKYAVMYSALYLSQACTIGVRYSAIRRQGTTEEGKPEVKILDYQTQQYRLLPQIALSYALIFTYQQLREFYFDMITNFTAEKLAQTHALTSALKALSTRNCSTGTAIVQQACGGIGYLLASRLPDIYSALVGGCYFDGDNTVLLLQTARYLIKSYKMIQDGEQVPSTVKYLHQPINLEYSQASVVGEYVAIYQRSIANMIKSINNSVEVEIKNGKQKNIALDAYSVELSACAFLHAQEYVLQCVHDFLSQAKMSKSLKCVLNQLFELLAIYWILENADLILYGSILKEKLSNMKSRIPVLLKSLRPNAVALVDAFDFCDSSLHSIIGCYDGNVYERIHNYWATLPENKQQFKNNQVSLPLPKANL